RRSLPRTAKVLSEVDGYTEQLFSPPKRHANRSENLTETPATKISKKMAAKLVIESPESVDENRGPNLRAPRAAARRLNLNEKASKPSRREPAVDSMETENDENVPPAGDTVGRRLPKRSVKGVQNVSAQPCTRTPLRMKIKRFDDVAKICESTVRYRSPAITAPKCKQVPSDACLMPLKTRLRAVLLDEKGGVAYRTVGPESPWGIKRPPARVVPVFSKLNKTPRKTNRDRSFDAGELEESSSGEDYSSDESEECDVQTDDDDDLLERQKQQK
ncbi:hypothetical protein OSTOST_14019, partial [Ostertagia ostertagi]